MTIWAFTGPESDKVYDHTVFISEKIRSLRMTECITGCSCGLDTLVALCATMRHDWKKIHHTLVVPDFRHNESFFLEFKGWQTEYPENFEIVQMPSGTGPLNRNDEMVKRCEGLCVFPLQPEYLRSGTWATVRRARKAGRTVRVYPLWREEAWEEGPEL